MVSGTFQSLDILNGAGKFRGVSPFEWYQGAPKLELPERRQGVPRCEPSEWCREAPQAPNLPNGTPGSSEA